MLRVALSGGIASGKTTVSNAFEKLGVPVVDADLLARTAVEPGSTGLARIVSRFGDSILNKDNNLDRAALRKIVFNDSKARADLEEIVHPEIRRLTETALEKHQKDGASYAIVVVPLLVETGQSQRYDHVIIVDVKRDTQLHRLQQRDGGSEAAAEKILASQATREQRLAIADDTVDNEGSIESIITQVSALHTKLLTLAGKADSAAR